MKDILKTIESIETHFDVNKLSYQGIKIWPLIRFSHMGSGLKFIRKPKSGLTHELKKLWVLWMAKVKDSNSNLSLKKTYHYGIYCDVIDRRIKIGNRYFSRIADSLQFFMPPGNRALTLEMSHEYIPARRYYPSYLVFSKIFFFLLKNRIAQSTISQKVKRQIAGFDEFTAFLKNRDLHLKIDEQNIIQQVEKILGFKKVFLQLLENLDIKHFYIIAYYSNIKMGLILACKELNINTIDVQHGLQGGNHLAYNFWHSVPQKGYSLLPDLFWVWSELDKENVERSFKNTPHNCIIGGNPWIAFYLNNAQQIDPPNINSRIKKGNTQLVLLTLASLEEFQTHWVVKTIKELQSDFLFAIRLHPAMRYQLNSLKDFLKEHGISRYNLLEANEAPIFSLLKQCDYHLTFLSTVAIEAFYFQKPSAIIHELGRIYYQSEIKKGMLSYLSCTNDFLQFTKQAKSQPGRQVGGASEIEKVKKGLEQLMGG